MSPQIGGNGNYTFPILGPMPNVDDEIPPSMQNQMEVPLGGDGLYYHPDPVPPY